MNLPHYHKRAFAHNYRAPFIYHIILKKMKGTMPFGEIAGDARIPYGSEGCAFIKESVLGSLIAKQLIEIQKDFPILQIYQFCVMPDHVHILLRVKDWSEHHLDYYIAYLQSIIATKYSQAANKTARADDIFEPGYCDKPLLLGKSLDGLFRYIRENPHRLAMRMQHPKFFQRVRRLKIGEQEYEAYGNLFLFRNPDKAPVKISRSFSEEEKLKKKEQLLAEASRGTVLVSPFISKAEKAIRAEAEVLGTSLILITHKAFPERYKPADHDFSLCSSGRLLLISLGLPPKTPLSRDNCVAMNALAEEICTQK